MIKNPKVGQKVWYFSNDSILEGKISLDWRKQKDSQKQVEINYWYNRPYSEVFETKQDAEKHLPKAISKLLKNLNEEILHLSEKRENLATKLAKLLEKGQ